MASEALVLARGTIHTWQSAIVDATSRKEQGFHALSRLLNTHLKRPLFTHSAHESAHRFAHGVRCHAITSVERGDMGSIFKHGDKYRAQVNLGGVRQSKVFRTKREANAWVDATEKKQANPEKLHTVAHCLHTYLEKETPKKKGHIKEAIRLNKFLREKNFPSQVLLSELCVSHMAEWRDARMQEVSAGTVLREISTLSAVFETARVEWGWLEVNPLKDMKKPRSPDHRETVIQPHEVKAMLKAMRYSPREPVRTVAQAVAVCFLTAIRTGCRASELTTLGWDSVLSDYCIAVGKMGRREVPLTKKALRLINRMRDYDPDLVFGMKASSLDANFRKYRDRAGLSGFTFHDTRHTAATMLSRKLDVMDLCKMFGWTNTAQALVYYNPTASSIADILNKGKS